jgi:hypothetical protein
MFGRVIAGEEGQDDDASEIEVLSDMQLILLDFLNYFHQQHGQEYVTDKAATLEHFTERTNDRTAGYSCVLELKQFYDWNKCQIPQSGATIPPSIDGLTLYDFCDQSVIDRLTAEQVACLEAEFGQCADATVQLNGTTVGTIPSGDSDSFTVNLDGSPSGSWDGTAWQVTSPPCDDATIELNGVEMTTIPSGDTENISVRQSSGATEVGSKQGVHWRIDDSAISINGSPVADVKAEDPLDIDVTQDGLPVGSWNGSAWIIPTCPVVPSLSVAVYSDAGHTTPISTIPTNTTVYVRAVPTDFTPDNYLFFSYDGTTIIKIGEQAGADISWLTLLEVTNGYVYAVASDSVSGNKTWSRVDFDVTGDPDAIAFIAAAGITDLVQKAAITTLVLQLKSDAIWSKFQAIYPLVGGTAFTHKFNLINPLDTNAAFRLLFSGGVTHNANGITGNGTNGKASTFYQPSVSATQNSASLSFYSRTNNTSSVVDMDTGSTSNRFGSYIYTTDWYATLNQATPPSSAAGGSLGMFEASRVSSTEIRKRKNGAFIVAETVTSNAPTSNILSLMSTGASLYSNRNYAFFSVGTHLDDTESANFYAAVQAFQTSLGRNV